MDTDKMVGSGKVLSTIYEWEIPNFTTYRKYEMGEFITSPVFYIHSSSWYLKMYPNGDIKTRENYLVVILCVADENTSVRARFSVSFLNYEKKVLATYSYKDFGLFNKEPGERWGARMRSSMAEMSMSKITILCEIITENVVIDKTLAVKSSSRVSHCQSFETFINNVQFSDIKLLIENKTIHVHKVILAANSAVFAAMFNHQMKENSENTVIIEDISYDVLHELLRFMYTGKSLITEEIVSQLFIASDKYQLLKLKEQCEDHMNKNLTINNVMEYLNLADMHNAPVLRKKAINLIVCHGQEMIDKPEFDSLRNMNAALFKEVFGSIFKRRKLQDNVALLIE